MRWLVALSLVAFLGPPANSAWRDQECRFQSLERSVWTSHEELLTARCVVGKWPIPGGMAALVSLGDCESGWNRFAVNGPYRGIFQHYGPAYPYRVRAYSPPWWDRIPTSWTNARGQIVTTVRMIRAVGFGPWSCR